jgi:hypothetical protein
MANNEKMKKEIAAVVITGVISIIAAIAKIVTKNRIG